jgi:RNA polymerase primary sigma factor
MLRQLKISKSITNRDTASLDKYLSDISVLPMISAEEESQLAREIRDGDQRALRMLVTANLRFVVSVAKQYQNQGISLPDLINEGNLGLIKAASRFDETRGFKFISYAVWWIRQSIMQAISEQSRVIRLPLNKVGLINKIRKAHDVLEQELERKPSSDEIAQKLGVSLTQIELTQQSSAWHVSTDALIHDGTATILDVFSDPDGVDTDGVLMFTSLQIEIERILSTLGEREREVIVLFYGIGRAGGLSLDEIGEKYSLTRERVRQIKEKAVRKLKHKSMNKNLRSFLG